MATYISNNQRFYILMPIEIQRDGKTSLLN